MKEQTTSTLIEGFVAGLLGYVSIALFFVLLNVVTGRPALETVSLLGTPLTGAALPAGGVHLPSALAYNGVHLGASLAVGFVAAWLFLETELHPGLWYVVFFLLLSALIFSLVIMGTLGSELLGAVGWGEVLTANLIWASGILGYLGWRHRGLSDRLGDPEA